MTGTHIGRVYEYVQPYHRSRREVLSENEPKNIWVDRYRWLLKYTVAREAESTTVQVYVDFTSRYRFSDQATLEVKVKTMDKAISKKINIEKRMNQLFSVDLTETGFSEVKNEDLKVICKISLTKIQYTNEKIGTSAHFSADSRPHDVVLLVGEKKFYVHKMYLATWSKYFDTLFYGNFAEKDKKEVKLEDVDSTEFEKLLSIIHPCIKISLTDKNVPYLLKLADRFDMPSVMAMCGNYLINFENCKWLSIMERLELSDKYNLTHLQEACLKSIHRKDPAEFTSFLEENREKIRTLSSNTVHNLI